MLLHVEAKVSKKRRREPAHAKCLTDESVLEEMKSKVKEKEEKEKENRAKALEREDKRRQKELKLERKQQKKKRKRKKAGVERKKKRGGNESLVDLVSNLKISDSEESGADSGDTVSNAVRPTCGVLFSTDGKRRLIGCDGCGDWYHINCTYLKGKRQLSEHFSARTVCKW